MRRLVALVAVALGACGCGSSATLDVHAFEKDAESLQSIAAETALLAAQVAEGEGTTYFTRVHSEYLSRDAKTLETTLSTAHATAAVERKRVEAARLAAHVTRDLAQLHAAPTDRELAARLHGDLLDAADAAEKLAQ